MNGKVTAVIATACAVIGSAAWSAEKTWQGGSSGAWADAANWAGGVPTAADVARFDSAATVSLAEDVKVNGLVFNADVTLTDGTDNPVSTQPEKTIYLTGGPCEVAVADGKTANVVANVHGLSNTADVLRKTGAGIFNVKGHCGGGARTFEAMVIEAGELVCGFHPNSDGLAAMGDITIENGAAVRFGGNNQAHNNQIFHIKAGGLLDCKSAYDCIGGFYGEGTVTNAGVGIEWNIPADRQLKFGGRFHGQLKFYIPNGKPADYEYPGSLLIAGADTLATAEVFIPDYGGKPLQFAPGVGTFHFNKFNTGTRNPIVLEDTNGDPITLVGNFNTTLAVPLTGPGSLIHYDGQMGYTTKITNDVVRFSGRLGTEKGYLYLGNGLTGKTPDLSSPEEVYAAGEGTLYFNNADDYRVDTPVRNAGAMVAFGGAASPTLATYAAAGGTVRQETDGVGTITFERFFATNTTVTANGKTDSVWRIQGGRNEGTVYRLETNGDRLVLDGGETHAAQLLVPGNANQGMTVEVNGGYHVFTNTLKGTGYTRYEIKGGELHAMRGTHCDSKSNITFYVSGGLLDVGSRNNWWEKGFGAEVSGNGRIVFSLTNDTAYAGNQDFRLSSDGYSHTLRVKDDGVVEIPKYGFKMMSMGGGNLYSTGTVEVLDRGIVRLAETFSDLGSNERGRTRVYFDGGTLVPTTANKTILDKNSFHTTEVGPRGMTVDTREIPVGDSKVTVADRLIPAQDLTDGAVDGGLRKKGCAQLRFTGGIGLGGPLDYAGGVSYESSAATDWGTGDLTLRNGFLELRQQQAYPLAGGAGSTVSFVGAQLLSVKKGSAVTLGDAAAESSALVVGEPGSVLVLQDGVGTDNNETPFDGTTKVKVGGGVAVSSASGLVTLPVFSRTYASSQTGDRFVVGPLTYTADDGFRAAAQTEGLARGAAQVAKVTAATTLAADAAAASVSVRGVASGTALDLGGHRLTVGDGEAPASVFLNAGSSLNQVPTIANGTLDFGDSEGYVVNNAAKGNNVANLISATIAGTKGVTFAATPTYSTQCHLKLVAANTYAGDTYVRNVKLWVGNSRAFSTGTVRVLGDDYSGGALRFDTANVNVANPLVLSGRGVLETTSPNFGLGVLDFQQTATVSGAIELADDATVTVSMTKTATLSGAISGNASLAYSGEGVFVVTGVNSYTGTTTVKGGTLQIASSDNVGAGAVTVAGKLRFVNADRIVFDRPLLGEGQIELAGANVAFSDLSGFRGTIVSTGTGALDLNGKDAQMLSLDGAGNIVNSSREPATLELTSDNDRYDSGYTGTIGGNIDLVKTGANTIYLGANATYEGSTLLAGGTLVLGPLNVTTNNPVAGAALRLDASRTDTLTLATGMVGGETVTFVTEWRDADGNGFVFGNNTADVDNDVTNGTKQHWPIYKTHGDADFGGFGTVWFDGVMSRLVSTGTPLKRRTIFVAMRPESNGTHPRVTNAGQNAGWNCIGIFGQSGYDSGLRMNWGGWSTDGWNDTPMHFRCDGEEKNKFAHGVTSVSAIEYSAPRMVSNLAVGDYWGNGPQMRSAFGDIAEIVVYEDLLGDIARAKVEDYLMKKWGVREFPEDTERRVNVLPETTSLTLNAPAVLDLAGSRQTLDELSGDGTIVNTSSRKAYLDVKGGYKNFTGTIGDNIVIVRPGFGIIIR